MNAFYIVLVEYQAEKVKIILEKASVPSTDDFKYRLCAVHGVDPAASKISYFDPDFEEYVRVTELSHLPNKFKVLIQDTPEFVDPNPPLRLADQSSTALAVPESRHGQAAHPAEPPKPIASAEDDEEKRESYLPNEGSSVSALGGAFRTNASSSELPSEPDIEETEGEIPEVD